MLNLSQLKRFGPFLQPISQIGKYLLSTHAVKEVRADYMMIVEDKAG
jgi:hypothetical protein